MPKRISKKDKALYLAAVRGDLAELEKLLSEGANPNVIVSNGAALHYVADKGRVKVIHALIEAGADIELLDSNDCTPLMSACNIGKVGGSKGAMALLDLGAKPRYVRSGDDRTPLGAAIARGTPELLTALIARGALVNGPRGTDITPLMLAARYNRVEAAELLLKHGADLLQKCKLPWAKGLTAEDIAVLEKKKAVAEYLRTARGKGRPRKEVKPRPM